MGKGDRKSKRGKIWRGTTGKRRPGSQKLRKLKKERAASATASKS